MKSAMIVAVFRRLAAPLLAVVLLFPGALAADEPVPSAASLATVAASGNLMNVAVYDALLSAGADEQQARAAAQSVANTNHLATKSDLAEVKSDIADLRSDLILIGTATAGAIVLMMLAGFHLLQRGINELAERLPQAAA